MLFVFSDFSDFSVFFFMFYDGPFILENSYSIIEIDESRVYYITLKWKLLHVNSYLYLYFVNVVAFTSVISLKIVRRFFIENKFYFFFRKEITRWVMHISIRIMLYIIFIPICTVYYIYRMVRYKFLDFALLSFFSIMFSAFFMLWYSPWGVFFLMLTFAVHGFMTILWLDLDAKIFFIKNYWKPVFRKMSKIASFMHIEATFRQKLFLKETMKNYRMYQTSRQKPWAYLNSTKSKNLRVIRKRYTSKSRDYYNYYNYW